MGAKANGSTNSMNYEHEVLESQIEIQKQAFERVGAELYDNVGQMLAVAKLYLCTLEESALNEEQQAYVKQINEIVGKTISDLRTLIRNLEAYLYNNFDLTGSLGTELQRMRKTKKESAELLISGIPYSLGYEKEIVLFRIVQELINRLIHTGTIANLVITLQYNPAQFIILIQYEGMRAESAILEQRIGIIGGKYSFENKKRKVIKIKIPAFESNN